jgi:hypothetical protein
MPRFATTVVWIFAIVPPWLALVFLLFGPIHLNFLEHLFDFAPDHGDGSFEAVAMIVFVAMITGAVTMFFVEKER